MRLIDKASNRQLREGDEVQLGNRTYNISSCDPKGRFVCLFSEATGNPFSVMPGAIGAKYEAVGSASAAI